MLSTEIHPWVAEGYAAGNPIATAILFVQFFVVNLVNLFTGGPVL